MNDTVQNGVPQEDRTMGMIAHLSALVMIGPLIIWLMNKDLAGKSFVTNNAKEALNFVITLVLIGAGLVVTGTILAFIPILGWIAGFFLYLCLFVVWIGGLVFIILAGLEANKGVEYRYPFALRFIA